MIAFAEARPRPDIIVEDHGTVVLLRGATARALEWILDNVQSEPWQWMGNAVACEPRAVPPVIDGALDYGLIVRFA